MSNIALKRFTVGDAGIPVFDIAVALANGAADLEEDGGLESAVLLSLFLNRRATADDILPPGVTDRGGWWPEAFDADTGVIGSRLWLLWNKAITTDVLGDFKSFSEEALSWLIAAGIASRVAAVVTRHSLNAVEVAIDITQADGRDWTRTWQVTLGEA